MVHQLQALNSILSVIAGMMIPCYFLLLQEMPVAPRTSLTTEEVEETKEKIAIVPEFIFQNDLFSTFNPAAPSLRTQKQIPPIPSFSWEPIAIPAEPLPPALLPALSIVLNGIVLASDDEQSIAVISDETLKEKVYYVGDQIKDAFLAKIMKNKIVLFRSNGQQETLFLRKEDEGIFGQEQSTAWSSVITKINDFEYQIDPEGFRKKFSSLGSFIEAFKLIPLVQGNGLQGVICEETNSLELLNAFGVIPQDILISINNILLEDQKKVLKVYEEVCKTPSGGTVDLLINRSGQMITMRYTIQKIIQDLPRSFSGVEGSEGATGVVAQTSTVQKPIQRNVVPQQFNKPDERQQRREQKTLVEDQDSSDYYDTVMRIRKRLVENMNKRSPHTYVR